MGVPLLLDLRRPSLDDAGGGRLIDLELCTIMMYSPADASIVFHKGRGATFRVIATDPLYQFEVSREIAGLLRNVHNDGEGA